ncbi:MAG: hypothetical protein GQ554_04360 [Deltaproteobacteria bacterium]|nr:hypothetical protein [Deltaproteobacteria bacterium]
MKKALFLVNAVSGRPAGKKIKENIIAELNGVLARDNYDIVFTEANIAGQIKNVSPDYETVVVVGGDGTIHQVVQGIVGLKSKPKVGIIPTGTGNDLARSLGILSFFKSHGLRALLELILEGKTINIDIISLGDKYLFTNYFGIGNDAKISNYFNRIRLRPFFPNGYPLIFNKVLYGVLGLTNGFYTIPFDVELKYRKEQSITKELTVPSGICGIIITNIKTYAGGDLLSSKCIMDDGKFEVTIISSIWQWLTLHVTRFLRKPLNVFCPKMIQFQTDKLEMVFTGNTFFQIDGETLDSFPEERKRLMVRVESHMEMIVP